MCLKLLFKTQTLFEYWFSLDNFLGARLEIFMVCCLCIKYKLCVGDGCFFFPFRKAACNVRTAEEGQGIEQRTECTTEKGSDQYD